MAASPQGYHTDHRRMAQGAQGAQTAGPMMDRPIGIMHPLWPATITDHIAYHLPRVGGMVATATYYAQQSIFCTADRSCNFRPHWPDDIPREP